MSEPEVPCPSCGNDPEDDSLHKIDCERNGTCGQIGPPWIDPPWHPDPESGWTVEWCRDHRWHVHGVGETP